MGNITLVMLCAGSSSRFGLSAKKQWLRTEHNPLWLFVTNKLSSYYDFDKIIVVSSHHELNYMQNFDDQFHYVAGGQTRQESMKNALQKVTSEYVMISDVARSCVPSHVIDALVSNKGNADCIVPYLNVSDTVVYEDETIHRENVKLIQTPQLSKTAKLKEALNSSKEFTDDSSAIKDAGGTVKYILGDKASMKLTFDEDLKHLSCVKAPSNATFVGTGFDIHPFEEGKKMVLGGVEIDVPYGFKAHSDGDVLIHSLIDALLGAAGAGDIGEFFPDTDAQYKNIDSKKLLTEIVAFIYSVGYEIVNVDLTIVAQQPKINPYKHNIKTTISELLNIPKQCVNIKATTAEKLGFVGRKEGVAVQSSAALKYYDWKCL
ncbi:bifunctional 2-C-methyl-D-erythritol 4-phosphate cytidylyltransferase/2-C-methyl-D-erythritol 2,4-cyclodiphosphate synthase [Candidatus Marinarcus aquaticus]|uniref:Bifunctional enzyme IspD/IspF n=1 Tax=Candidatus Marinarcus aquaticus TaxID=2044504 RepID=A0A4Q0XRN8_9BACT|nr:bifunctional 2-C-methyl-D-erythritol 4-phosphate cytidylyltransferase/2-C-methyl-D-erythritol 2,4-cyclodiphosphate synthase [Candidatus Marinarcus aquaticus]RXJ57945.1 bifunctional 2-C-methyl-D-erythritol 4-phosphate cytidylyltransferase/2-C-methyl-D-erythritol 2,4-cyclodiphosphate synthase [Candidatus Marinarcus aquaticus]